MTSVIVMLLALGAIWAGTVAIARLAGRYPRPSRDARVSELYDLVARAEEAMRVGSPNARELAMQAIEHAMAHLEPDAPEAAWAWQVLGAIEMRDEAWADAAGKLERASMLARGVPTLEACECYVLEELAMARAWLGDDERAARALDEAEAARRAWDAASLHETWTIRATVAVIQGDLQRAEDHQRAALRALDAGGQRTPYRGRGAALRPQGNDLEGASLRAHSMLAAILHRCGRATEAEACLDAALEVAARVRGPAIYGAAFELAAYFEAQDLLEGALRILEGIASIAGSAPDGAAGADDVARDALLDASRVAWALGLPDRAGALASRALHGSRGATRSSALLHQAWLRYVRLDHEGGERLLSQAMTVPDAGIVDLPLYVALAQVEALFAVGKTALAFERLDGCVIGDPLAAVHAAELAARRGHGELAEDFLKDARSAAREGARWLVRHLAIFDAELLASRGELDAAEKMLATVDEPRLPPMALAAFTHESAWLAHQRGHFSEAALAFARAAHLSSPSGGPRHRALSLGAQGAALVHAGCVEEARGPIDRARSLVEGLAPSDVLRAYVDAHEATLLLAVDRAGEALVLADRGAALERRWHGARSTFLPRIELLRVRALLALGREEALAQAREAHALALAAHGHEHSHVAEHARVLASALLRGDDRERHRDEARTLLAGARELMARHGHEHLAPVESELSSLD